MTFVSSFKLHALDRTQKHGKYIYWYASFSASSQIAVESYINKLNHWNSQFLPVSQCLVMTDMSLEVHVQFTKCIYRNLTCIF